MRAASLTVAAIVASAPVLAPPGQPLDVAVIDESAFPTVTFDLVTPVAYTSFALDSSMVTVDGSAVSSLTPVDPATVAVSLIIDDRPELDEATIVAEQAAAVELGRNLGEGTQLALFTPSGLMAALTTDRDPAIGRLGGITAGADSVMPLPEVLLEAVDVLVESPLTDRHLVVVLGAPISLDEAQLAALSEAVASSGTRVHVLAPNDLGQLADVALASDGLIPATADFLAGMDRITNAIANRYRAVATVSGAGEHTVELLVQGARFTELMTVEEPPPTTAAPTTVAPTAAASTDAAPTTVARAPATAVASTAQATPAPTQAPAAAPRPTVAQDDGTTSRVLVPLLLLALVAAVVVAFMLLRRRGGPKPAVTAAVEPEQPEPDPELAAAQEPPPPIVELEPDLEPVRDPESVGEPEVEPVAESTEPAPEPEPEPESVVEAEPQPVVEPVAALGAAAAADAGVQTASRRRRRRRRKEPAAAVSESIDSEPEPISVSPPVAESEPEVEPVPGAEQVAQLEVEPEAAPVVEAERPVVAEVLTEYTGLTSEPDIETVAAPEPAAEAEPATMVEPEPTVAPEPEIAPSADAAVAPEQAEAELAPDVEPAPVSEAQVEPESGATVVEPEPKVAPEAETAPSADAEVAPGQAVVEPESTVAPEPEPVTVDEPELVDEETEAEPERPPAAIAPLRPARRGQPLSRPRRARGPRRSTWGAEPDVDDDVDAEPDSRGRRRAPLARDRAHRIAEEPSPRVARGDTGWIVSGPVRMSPSTGEVWRGKRRVQLNDAELKVLELLITQAGRGLTSGSILDAAGLPRDSGRSAIDGLIAQVRRKTGIPSRNQVMRKERSVVYYLDDGDPDDVG